MGSSFKIIPLLLGAALFAGSCCKEGTDGKATLVVYLEHHGKNIPNQSSYPDTVYIAFNATDAPGIKFSTYDTFVVGTGTDDHVTINDLKCGDYFLFGVGLDNGGPYRVTGGLHVKIKHKERKKTKDVHMAVTE